ncbi:MAG: autoinducer synthesis protein [Micavibrio aeruginosavorus]|nr:autoinducer synthesis protein [Micavibrio aeruginosavorus]
MITCVTYDNLKEFGDIFYKQFLLRHEGFIERQDYDVSVYKGMEYDQYDTPASAYLIYHTDDNHVLGVNRLTPTTHSCMLRDLWPDLVHDKNLLNSPDVWEGTRYCIDKHVSPDLRQTIIHEMALAYLEFGLDLGLKKIIGMMPTYIYRSVFERPGIEMEYLGDIQVIGRHKIRAVAIPVDHTQKQNVQQKTGITGTILRYHLSSQETVSLYGRAA